MTRIYFQPQNASARHGKVRKEPAKGSPHQQRKQDDASLSGWRSKLEPNAIEQIADGLEKMVLSWTQPKEDHNHGRSDDRQPAICGAKMLENGEFPATHVLTIQKEDATTISLLHPSQLIDCDHGASKRFHSSDQKSSQAILPDIEEIMRGELIKNCRPSIRNGEVYADYHQVGDLESPFWYLLPALALPKSCGTLNSGEEYTKVEVSCREFHAGFEMTEQGSKYECKETKMASANGGKMGEFDCISRHADQAPEVDKLSCKINMGGSRIWSETVEITGGNRIRDLLGRKLALLSHDTPASPQEVQNSSDFYRKKAEELQLALLECAMEYEVKIVEMKMQMLQSTSSQHNRISSCGNSTQEKSKLEGEENMQGDTYRERRDAQRVDYLRKQLWRLQHEKVAGVRELHELKKRERQFDLQRRSLDDALNRVNTLQSELGRKEQDIVNCQLREKEAKAQLYELHLCLQRAHATQIEPKKLMTLLLALKEWVQTSEKGQCDILGIDNQPLIDKIVCAIIKEAQVLQNVLSQLTCKG